MNPLAILIMLAAPPSPAAITLEDALATAADAPSATAARAAAEAADARAVAVGRSALLPVVAIGAEYRRVRDPLEITTPIGPFQTEPERVLGVGVDVTQPLFSPGPLLYAAPAARHGARAARLNAERARQVRAAQIGDAWLAVEQTDAHRAATTAFVASLEERLRMMNVLVEAGRGLEADRLKVQLALDQARQDLRALAAQRRVATLQLGQALGRDTPVDVTGGAHLSSSEAPGARPDLQAIDAQRAATATRKDGILGDLLPRVELFGRARYADTDLVADRTWIEGGVALTWVPFAQGTRSAQAAALDAEARALAARRVDAARAVEVEVAGAQAAVEVAEGQVEVARRGIVQAEASLDLEQQRYARAAATMNDVIAAEATLRERRTQAALARLAATAARLQLRLARGQL